MAVVIACPPVPKGPFRSLTARQRSLAINIVMDLVLVLVIVLAARLSLLNVRLTNMMKKLYTHGLIVKNQLQTRQRLRGAHHSRSQRFPSPLYREWGHRLPGTQETPPWDIGRYSFT